MELINMHITSAELYRRNNIDPMTFTHWRESFAKSGKSTLSGKVKDNVVKTLTKENESIKKLIDKLTIDNDDLKKTLKGKTYQTNIRNTKDYCNTLTHK